MMELIRADLKALGVEMDVFYSEKSLYGTGQIEAALERLENKGPDLRRCAGAAEGQAARRLGSRVSRPCSNRLNTATTLTVR